MKKVTKKPQTYIERDVSWMYFNHRILQEAEKENVPALEKMSFLGIYSNNLDEFFRVRMATLNRIAEAKDKILKRDRLKAERTIQEINQLNALYTKEYGEALIKMVEILKENKIRILRDTELNEEQEHFIKQFYLDKLNGATNPVWLSHVKQISDAADNCIYLAVKRQTWSPENKKPEIDYALIKVPDKEFGRFIQIPSSEGYSNVMYLDDVIRYCLPLIFIGSHANLFEAYSFKFTKDAEMEIDNDLNFGVMQKVSSGIKSRKRGEPIRVIYDSAMPKDLLKKIMMRLNIDSMDTIIAGGRYQNHKDLMGFPSCGHAELKYPKWQPILKPELSMEESILDQIRQKDRFIHVPYHSFDSYIRVLREAALNPDVKSIKTTLYRLAKDSKVVKALICAARNGKKVTVVIELLARFDEESNIKWAKKMQEEGIHVIFGVEGLKVHSKLLHITSKSGNIACIGTGNFHEGNAKIYTDYLMMTARPGIVKEVSKVFDFIERPFTPVRFRELLVSPNEMKTKVLRMIDNEVRNAKAGKEAWIKIKINHITDVDVVNRLYKASAAGVKVDILLRGNCSVVPGIPGVSDNIHIVGIIDRYLEHSRILIFCNGGATKYYLGSADWMPRNLVNRVEVMTSVYDPDLQADLLRTVEFGLNDTTNGRIVDGKGTNEIQPVQNNQPFRSQEELYKAYKAEAEAFIKKYENDKPQMYS